LTGETSVDKDNKEAEDQGDVVTDVGMIERPRDIAVSSSQQHLQRSLRGHSDAGSRQSSSLNRERHTSPDHIPRIHECWSLEPVRRAHRTHHTGSELTSDLSSVDSLPVSARPTPSQLAVGESVSEPWFYLTFLTSPVEC